MNLLYLNYVKSPIKYYNAFLWYFLPINMECFLYKNNLFFYGSDNPKLYQSFSPMLLLDESSHL